MRRSACILAALALLGCDDVIARTGGAASATPRQQRALRALITSRGIEALLTSALQETGGLEVSAPARELGDAQLGPIEQVVPVNALAVDARDAQLGLTIDFADAALLVPVRSGTGAQTHICRWRVQLEEAASTITLALNPASQPRALAAQGEAIVSDSQVRADLIGSCALDTESLRTPAFDSELESYAREALAGATRRFGERSLLDDLGALRSTLTLERLSALETRLGSLRLSGALSDEDPARLSTQGASYDLAYAVDVPDPTTCAPIPSSLTPPRDGDIASIDDLTLAESETDSALFVSEPLLANVARLGVRAGFSCQGLDQLGAPGFDAPGAMALDQLFLEDLGIDTSAMGPRALMLLSPGSLPEIVLEPTLGTVKVIWRSLHVDVYVEVFGAPVRALRLISDVTLDFKPREGEVGTVRFDIEALEIDSAELETKWLVARPTNEELITWAAPFMARRVFGNSLQLPLPLAPDGARSRVVRAIVRDRDVALLTRFVP